MKIVKLYDTNHASIIKLAKKTLQSGGMVIFPTETTYGLGVDATNQKSVDKLLAYKSRREGKPLSVAVANTSIAKKYVSLNKQAEKLYKELLPGPFTIISNGLDKVARGVQSEFGTLGIRIPDYPFMLSLLSEFKKGITATSANASGKRRPYTIKQIFSNLSDKQKKLIDLVIDAGELPKNNPSTIIDTTLSTPLIMRSGKYEYMGNKDDKRTQLTIYSKSETETKNIAKRFLLKYWSTIKKEPLVIGLNGELGAGKTIFAKGIAEYLQIKKIITSPTYSYINEYPYNFHQSKGVLYHLDIWKVDNQENFDLLKFDSLMRTPNIIVIEWWNQIQKYLDNEIIKKALIFNIEVEEKNSRKILINEPKN